MAADWVTPRVVGAVTLLLAGAWATTASAPIADGLVAHFPFADDLDGWTAEGGGTLTLEGRRDFRHAILRGPSGAIAVSPEIAMTDRSTVVLDVDPDHTARIALVTASREPVVEIQLGTTIMFSNGTLPDGRPRMSSMPDSRFRQMNHVVIELDGPDYTVTVDQVATARAPRLTLEEPRHIVVKRIAWEATIESVLVTNGPLPIDESFRKAPQDSDYALVLAGSGRVERHEPNQPVRGPPGYLWLHSDATPGSLAYVALPAAGLEGRALLKSTHLTLSIAEDHAAALAGLDEDGAVVWAITTGWRAAATGFWFHGGAAPGPTMPYFLFEQRPRVVWALTDAAEGTVDVYVDEAFAGRFHGIALDRVTTIAAGDVWPGVAPTGSASILLGQLTGVRVP